MYAGGKPAAEVNHPGDQNQGRERGRSPPTAARGLEDSKPFSLPLKSTSTQNNSKTKNQNHTNSKQQTTKTISSTSSKQIQLQFKTKTSKISFQNNTALDPGITGESCTKGGTQSSSSEAITQEIKIKAENTGQGDTNPHIFKTQKQGYPIEAGPGKKGSQTALVTRNTTLQGEQRNPD